MLKHSILYVALGSAVLLFAALAGACGSSDPLPAPKGDSQFDDPDQPPAAGVIGAVGAGSGKDGGDASTKCSMNGDCRPGLRCFFPVSEGCAAQGQCLDFQDTRDCPITQHCSCAGTRFGACSPTGYAAEAVASATCLDASASD
jgi:hypothetical protein